MLIATARAALAALTVAAVSVTPALAQGGTWGAVYPQAWETGAPAWVRPGTRIVSYVASASVANSRHALVEDANGDLENPRTGKRYRRTDVTRQLSPGCARATCSMRTPSWA